MLIVGATFREPWEAHMFCARLHAEELFGRVAHEYHVGNNWAYSTALGGVKVLVLSEQLEAVRTLRAQCIAGEFKSILENEFGDLDDPRCPVCGFQDYWRRRPLVQASFAVIISFLFVIFPPWNWLRFCNHCGAIFRQKYGLIGKSGSNSLPAMTFSEATASDVSDISLSHHFFDTTLQIEDNVKAWVCRVDGIVRGYSFANSGMKSLSALFVEPDFKRSGIGRTLHNHAVGWLFKHGITTIHTKANSRSAVKFLNVFGWRLTDQDSDGGYLYELDRQRWQTKMSQPRSLIGMLHAWRNRESG